MVECCCCYNGLNYSKIKMHLEELKFIHNSEHYRNGKFQAHLPLVKGSKAAVADVNALYTQFADWCYANLSQFELRRSFFKSFDYKPTADGKIRKTVFKHSMSIEIELMSPDNAPAFCEKFWNGEYTAIDAPKNSHSIAHTS